MSTSERVEGEDVSAATTREREREAGQPQDARRARRTERRYSLLGRCSSTLLSTRLSRRVQGSSRVDRFFVRSWLTRLLPVRFLHLDVVVPSSSPLERQVPNVPFHLLHVNVIELALNWTINPLSNVVVVSGTPLVRGRKSLFDLLDLLVRSRVRRTCLGVLGLKLPWG